MITSCFNGLVLVAFDDQSLKNEMNGLCITMKLNSYSASHDN